jgi:conjugative relaxase-like TrwC/TraI family protein
VVASISARGGVRAALSYYGHLGRDDYYLRKGEPPGRWAGEGAARLSLDGPVIRSDFEAALNGIDPKTGAQLARLGGKGQNHAAGWDMTFSAPKSVSVLWALLDPDRRSGVEHAHGAAVAAATGFLERQAAWARRGKAGAVREPTAGLLMATFAHHTSRALDPQLHTHVFVFNLAPRKDGTWGAIVSRELYKAQMQAGAVYREALANAIEREGYALERSADGFRVAAIPRDVERAFSKRRQSIETSAELHGYRTPKGMELAALRTREAKRDVRRETLFETWRGEAQALGCELKAGLEAHRALAAANAEDAIRLELSAERTAARTPVLAREQAGIGSAVDRLTKAAQAVGERSSMPGLAVDLRQRAREASRER